MNIRLANAADVPAIMHLVRRVVPLMRAAGNLQWDDIYPNAEAFLNDIALAQLWVAVLDNTIAGATAITTEQYAEYAQLGWNIHEPAIVTHRLLVDPEQRGKGIAVALMRQAETVARAKGISILRVDTNTHNEATQRLFPKLGYTFAGDFSLAFRPGLRFFGYEKRLA